MNSSLTAHPWSGYFINLDRSTRRRAAMEAGLSKLGLSAAYRRFAAVDGASLAPGRKLKPGQLGCFQSHYQVLRQTPHDERFVHILEDDVVLSKEMMAGLHTAIVSGHFDQFDLVFTDIVLPDDLQLIRILKGWFDAFRRHGTFQLFDLKKVPFAGTASYLANPKSLERITSMLWVETKRDPDIPIDLWLRKQVHEGKLKAACLFPFVTTVNGGVSIIDGRAASPTLAAEILLRQAFFVGSDLNECRSEMQRIAESAGPSVPDPHLDLLTDILRFYVSDKFHQF